VTGRCRLISPRHTHLSELAGSTTSRTYSCLRQTSATARLKPVKGRRSHASLTPLNGDAGQCGPCAIARLLARVSTAPIDAVVHFAAFEGVADITFARPVDYLHPYHHLSRSRSPCVERAYIMYTPRRARSDSTLSACSAPSAERSTARPSAAGAESSYRRSADSTGEPRWSHQGDG